jgi:hypothetical protein
MPSTIADDLSKYHTLISDLFETPKSAGAWDQYRLSDEQIQFFHTNGYLSHVKLLEPWQIDVLNEELTKLVDPELPGHQLFYEFHSNESSDPGKVLLHALGAWRVTPGFHDVLWNPAFLMAASQLLGDQPVRFWHDQLFCKPAHHGGVVAWHQDYSYWTRTVPMQHLTCWTGLDDARLDNGCVHYIPGSHKWGLLEKPELAGNMESLQDSLTEEQRKEFKPVAIEMERGYATFHHPLTIHGSYENSSERPRRAFVINVFADGTQSATDTELLAGVPIIPEGHKMQGRFFPLLYKN